MKGQAVLFSSKNDEWATPQFIYDWLNDIHSFTLDPCASDDNHKCDKYFTIETDGLKQSWKDEVVFINPPYSDISKWVEKSFDECVTNNAKCVLLIPSRTDTKYWHRFIMPAAHSICFLQGRLKFGNSKNSAPFPSCIVYFEPKRAGEKYFSSSISDTVTYGVNIKLIKERYDH